MMNEINQMLSSLAADNTEEGVSFEMQPEKSGKKVLSMQQVEELAFPSASQPSPTKVQQAPTQQAQIPTNLNLPASKNILQTLDKRLMLLSKEKDPLTAAKLLSDMTGEIAAEQARFVKDAQSLSYTEFGVPDLEKQLKLNKQMDMNSPAYIQKYGNTDSDETESVRRQLLQAKNAADSAIKEKLMTNETFNKLQASAKTLETFGMSQLQKSANRSATLEFEAEKYMTGLGAEGKIRASYLNKDAVNNPIGFMLWITGQPKAIQDSIETTLRAREEDMPLLALKGNQPARMILEKQEVEKIGSVAKDLLRAGYQISDNPKVAMEKFQEMNKAGLFGNMPEKEKKNFEASLNPILASLGDKKENHEISINSRANVAYQYMKWKSNQIFNSDITKHPSNVPLPAYLQQAMQDPKINSGSGISRRDAVTLAAKGTPEQAKINRDQLVAFYGSAADRYSKSSLFAIDPLESKRLETEVAMNLSGFANSILGNMRQFADATIPELEALYAVPGAVAAGIMSTPYNLINQPLDKLDPKKAFRTGMQKALENSPIKEHRVPQRMLDMIAKADREGK